MAGRFAALREWGRSVLRDVTAVYFAARDDRTPPVVRLLAFIVAAYALSPIDLIPDFIPVAGYLDDLLIVPIGVAIVIRLLPSEVLASARARATELARRPRSALGAALVIVAWVTVATLLALWWRAR